MLLEPLAISEAALAALDAWVLAAAAANVTVQRIMSPSELIGGLPVTAKLPLVVPDRVFAPFVVRAPPGGWRQMPPPPAAEPGTVTPGLPAEGVREREARMAAAREAGAANAQAVGGRKALP